MTEEKYNVLYIENGTGFGGAVVSLCLLLKNIDKHKYNPIVLSTHNDLPTRKSISECGAAYKYVTKYKRGKKLNEAIIQINEVHSAFKFIFLLILFVVENIRKIPFIIKLISVINENNIKLIHVNNNINDNFEVILVAKVLKIKSICHIRGPEYNSFESRFISKHVTYLIVISDYVKDSLLKLGISSQKIRIIHNVVDVDECVNRANNKDLQMLNKFNFGRTNIGLIGCLLEWKGHATFIDAIDILVRKYAIKDCKFFIIGDVPNSKSDFMNKLINRVNKFNLNDFVIFTGYQDNVFQFIDLMNIIVHTSIKPEPFGRVIIEAMALGKAVIASNTGGPKEIIANNENGVLIPHSRPEILAREIFNLLKDKKKTQIIAEAAKLNVKKKYTIDQQIRKIEILYEDTLK